MLQPEDEHLTDDLGIAPRHQPIFAGAEEDLETGRIKSQRRASDPGGLFSARSRGRRGSFSASLPDPFDLEDDTIGDRQEYVDEDSIRSNPLLPFKISSETFMQQSITSNTGGNHVWVNNQPPAEDRKGKGAFRGVFLPTCENMWGILIFLKFMIVVGKAGIVQAMCAVCLTFLCCLMTVFSMNASASSGGMISASSSPYHVINKSLGPRFGISVGLTYVIGNILLGCLETVGSVEVLLQGVASADIGSGSKQFYSISLSFLLFCVMFSSERLTKHLGHLSLIALVGSVIFLIGTLANISNTKAAELNPLITGWSWDTFVHNFPQRYDSSKWSFGDSLAVVFPSFAGVLCGANRAHVWRENAAAVRKGALSALYVSFLFYSGILIGWAGVANYKYLSGNEEYRTIGLERNLGAKVSERYLLNEIGWPDAGVFRGFIIFAAIGQAFISFLIAKRIFQQIVTEMGIPAIACFKLSGESKKTQWLLIYTVTLGFIVTFDTDVIAAALTMCFIVCFSFLNLSSIFLTALRLPTWRPTGIHQVRWRVFYITSGSLGLVTGFIIMFWVDLYWAGGILLFALVCYAIITLTQAEQDWGSGMDGLRQTLALKSIISIKKRDLVDHVNWRPQVLILFPICPNSEQVCHRILNFYSQLRKGGGMCVIAGILKGSSWSVSKHEKAEVREEEIRKIMKEEDLQGFPTVIVSPSFGTGANYMMQCCGVGALRPNTVLLNWPHFTGDFSAHKTAREFMATMRLALSLHMALLITLRLETFPLTPKDLLVSRKTLDVWWILHDGLMALIAWLLKSHRVWRETSLRVFTILPASDSHLFEVTRETLRSHLKKHRLFDVDIEVVIMTDDESLRPYCHKEDEMQDISGNTEMELSEQSEDEILERRPRKYQKWSDGESSEFSDSPSKSGVPYSRGYSKKINSRIRSNHKHAFESMLDHVNKINDVIYGKSKHSGLVLINMPDLHWWHTSANAHDFDETLACNYLQYCEDLVRGVPNVLFVHNSTVSLAHLF